MARTDTDSSGSKTTAAKDLKRTLILEHDREDMERLPEWPFDAPVFRRLAILVLAVVVSMISHLLILSPKL